VAETADGWLNDINGFHVKPAHVWFALDNAHDGTIAEGNVGGGTGMLCYEFKGGTGTSSRKLPETLGGWTVGALVQSNFGRRYQLTIAGVPIGQYLTENAPLSGGKNPFKQDEGSLIIILATDAPLLPHQLKRLAKRACLGMARTGALGGNGSGDIFLAFSTTSTGIAAETTANVNYLLNDYIDPLLFASAYASEEAIINSMIAGESMVGYRGMSIDALPHDKLVEILKQYSRLT
jgi:L-aminopeptidase/D-esterase-like protein